MELELLPFVYPKSQVSKFQCSCGQIFDKPTNWCPNCGKIHKKEGEMKK